MEIRIACGWRKQTIELPILDSELAFRMKRSGIKDIIPKCKLLEVSDNNDPLSQCVGDFVNLDEVNFFVKRMESLTEYEQKVLNAFAIYKGISDVKGLINLTYSLQGLSVITELSDTEEVGKRLYMDKHQSMPVDDENSINFIEYADKVFREQTVNAFPYGLLIENGFELQEVYNGRTFPKYVYDPENIVAVVEVSNAEGEKEYLYLPAEVEQWVKVKERLGIEYFHECQITDLEFLKSLGKFKMTLDMVSSLDKLTRFNEMCLAVMNFDEDQMKRLEMVVNFLSQSTVTTVSVAAYQLHKFEVCPNIHNDLEYGAYIIKESGKYDIPKEVLPYIQYGTFAMNRRKEMFHASDYVKNGFVGVQEDLSQFLGYQGEFAEPLEFNEDDYELFCLYSPLTAELHNNGWHIGDLDASDLMTYSNEIEDVLEEDIVTIGSNRGLMRYYTDSMCIAGKIISAFPSVVEINNKLYGVLECRIKEPLTEIEIQSLKEYWTGQMSDGWGEGFEQKEIKTEDGELFVRFWNSDNDWFVKTAEEMGIVQNKRHEVFCLYCPVTVQANKDDEYMGKLSTNDCIYYMPQIVNAVEKIKIHHGEFIRLMKSYGGSEDVISKVVSVRPKVTKVSDEVYGVLEFTINSALTAENVEELKKFFDKQIEDGWGEHCETIMFAIDEVDLGISFYDINKPDLIMTAEEMGLLPAQGMQITI